MRTRAVLVALLLVSGCRKNADPPAVAPRAPVTLPVVAGSTVLFGDEAPARVVIAGDLAVFTTDCCLRAVPLAGGAVTTLSTRTRFRGLAVLGDQAIWVGVPENGSRLTVAGVALPGAGGASLFPPRELPEGIEVAQLAVAGDDVYVVGNSAESATLFHWRRDGQATQSVPLGRSMNATLVASGARVLVIHGGGTVHQFEAGVLGARLGQLSDVGFGCCALDGDFLYYATNRALGRARLEGARFEGAQLEPDDWTVELSQPVELLAARAGRIAWSEAGAIYTAAADEPSQNPLDLRQRQKKVLVVQTPGVELSGLAIGGASLAWSVMWSYPPTAHTPEERQRTQGPGVVARTTLPR